ncbi:MAG: DUF2341 domain-containing protein, partial [Bacteroidota bacterium]
MYVSDDADDAWEDNGTMQTGDNDIDLGDQDAGRNKWAGFRFRNISIPAGATILSANIEFESFDTRTANTATVRIYADNAANPTDFDTDDITPRTTTTQFEDWTFGNWSTDTRYSSPDISHIIQELVDDHGGLSGMPIAILLDANGNIERYAKAHELGGATDVTRLTISYSCDAAPTALCQDATAVLNGSGAATIATTDIDNGSSDDCTGSTLSLSQTAFNCSNLGSNTVTLTVTDSFGKTGTCTSTVTVEDNTAPTATCQNFTATLDGSGAVNITTANIDNGSSDNCSVTLSLSQSAFSCDDIGDVTVFLFATDAAGNADTCSALVTIQDSNNPAITCPANTTVNYSRFDYKKTVTVNAGRVSGTSNLTNFPIRFSLVDADLRSVANGGKVQSANGYDILFYDLSNNKLDHQIESYDPVTGTLEAWITIPSLSPSANTTFEMHYGNTSLTTDLSVNTMWDMDYLGVYHMNGDVNDATFRGNDGTNNGTTAAAGQASNGRAFSGSGQYIQTPVTVQTAEEFTFSAWFQANSLSRRHMIWQGHSSQNGWGNGGADTHQEAHLSTASCCEGGSGADLISAFLGNEDDDPPPGGTPDVAQVESAFTDLTNWHNATAVFRDLNGTPTVDLYIDGVLVDTDNGVLDMTTARNNWDTNLRIGRPGNNSRYFSGIMDEVRISKVARSADWIQTQYNSVNQPITYPSADANDFYSISAEAASQHYCVYVLDDYTGGAAATDNCEVAVTQSPSAGSIVSANTTVTLTATDDGGNTDDCTFTVSINPDVTNPTAICQDQTVALNGAGTASVTAAAVDNNSTDDCDATPTLTLSQTSFNCAAIGTNLVTLTVEDDAGNSDECTATITVQDNINPTPACNATFTANINGAGTASISTADIDNGSSDNCTVNLSLSQTSFDCSELGANTVTLTVSDATPNTATCTSVVTVSDVTNPTPACNATHTLVLDGSGNATLGTADIDNGSSDNCSVSLSLSQTSFDCSDLGANTVVLTVTDGSGNDDTCASTVTVQDNTTPTLSCNANVTQDTDTGVCEAELCINTLTTSDNCGLAPVNALNFDGANEHIRITGMNYATTTLTEFTVEAWIRTSDGSDQIIASFDRNEYWRLEISGDGAGTGQIGAGIMTNGGQIDFGSTTRVDDGAWHHVALVYDNGTARIYIDGALDATTTRGTAVGSGNTRYGYVGVGSERGTEVSTSVGPSDYFNGDIAELRVWHTVRTVGQLTIDNCVSDPTDLELWYHFDDGTGSTTVTDLSCNAYDGDLTNMEAASDWITSTANVCLYAVNDFNNTINASDTYPLGTTMVTWTVTDVGGGTATCTQEIIIEDNEAPDAICQDITVNLTAGGSYSLSANEINNASTDNCDGTPALSISPTTFSCSNVGNNT